MKKYYIIVGFVIVLALGFSAVTAAQYNPEIYEAQRALQEKGYNPGDVDGIWGNATQSAVERFQQDVGLPISGYLDEQTKMELGIRHQKRGFKIKQRAVSPSGTEVKGNHWLFVIGIDTYIEWPRLKTAVSDARALKDVILTRYYFDKDHVIELYDEQATRKNIIGKLRYLAKNVRGDDSLFIFYAGHGHLDSITKSGSWIPVESGIQDASAWISNNYIKDYLKVDAIKAKHILLISDSCFAGGFFRGYRGKLPKVTDEVVKRAYKLTSRQAITSGGLEPVVDEGFGNHSVFSHFLIKTLKENQKSFLVPSDFFADIKAGVAENAEQFPRFGSLKDTGGQQGGEMVLFLKPESKLKRLSGKTSEREKELQRLKQMEVAVTAERKKEAEEIAKQERRLAELDKKIEEMRGRLGSAAKRSDDSLETLLAMVRQQEDQERRLKKLEQRRREEEQKRKAEIERLKEEQQRKRSIAFEGDLSKYLEIVNSQYGKDMKDTAWKSLISRYPEGEGLKTHQIDRLRFAVKGGGKKTTNSMGMEFVYIPPGTFMMGSPSNEKGRDNDEKQHQVTLTGGFYMQTTEITQTQWKAVMGSNPSNFKGDNRPVEMVSWTDIQAFIGKLNRTDRGNRYRLPTEAEWEYAARAGTDTPFSFGRCLSTDQANYDGNNPLSGCPKGQYRKQTTPAASFSPNAWGLYDMHGNVWEWVQDWTGDYPSGSVTDPKGPSNGSYRVLRGGSWYNFAWYCRSANRNWGNPGYRPYDSGFRLVLLPGQ